jgi:hypothetical protein
MIFSQIFSIFLGSVICAESNSVLFTNYIDCFEKLMRDMKNNNWNVSVLSEFKFSLDLLYKDQPKALLKQLIDFKDDQENWETLQKFTVYSLYHLPSNFSNFEVFEPFFRVFHDENSYDVALALNWLQMSMSPSSLSQSEQREEFNSWIYDGEYKNLVNKDME